MRSGTPFTDFATGSDFVLIHATNVNSFSVATNVSATARPALVEFT